MKTSRRASSVYLEELATEAQGFPIYTHFYFFSNPMGLDLTIVIFLLKCGLHGNMLLNIPGINSES